MNRHRMKLRFARRPINRRRRLRLLELEPLEDRRLLSTNVLTYHNDLARDGDDLTETTLTPSNVNMNTFGLLFSYPVDGQVYAQPLYMSNVALPDGSVHSIVFVETEHDSVYAFDANNPTAGPQGNGILWHDSFIDPAHGITPTYATDVGCFTIKPEIGITATPVIDPNTDIMYLVASTDVNESDGSLYLRQQLHALDVTTGNEVLGGPVDIQATIPGQGDGGDAVTFHGYEQRERAGLVLSNGIVYTSWASYCDNPAHGWVLGYDAQTLQQVFVFNSSPNGQLATIWGAAPAADADGNLYVITGNGPTSGGNFDPSLGDYPETALKLATGAGQPAVADYFTPSNEDVLDQADEDFGSGGVMLLPDNLGPFPHLLIAAGKQGTLYLINRDDMGQFNAGFDNVVQEVPNAIGGLGVYGTPAYFDAGTPNNRWIYYAGWNDALKAFQLFDDGTLSASSTSQSSNYFSAECGTIPSVSADGTTNGIVWAIFPAGSNAVLYAYDATNLANTLYTSSQAGPRDQLDAGIKFSLPTIADGQVFVGTVDTLSVFGLLPAGSACRGRGSQAVFPSAALLLPLSDPLTNPRITGVTANGGFSNAEQSNPALSPPVGPLLPDQFSTFTSQPVATDQYANDLVLALEDRDVSSRQDTRDNQAAMAAVATEISIRRENYAVGVDFGHAH
jgi:hypothetical protein